MLNENAIKSVLKLLYRSAIKKSTIQNLYRFFIHSAPEKLLFLNPNYIAVHIGLEQWEMLELLVRGLISGLFEMQWDISCPQCASTAEHSHIQLHGRYKSLCACQRTFDALFREIVSHSGGVIKTIGDVVLAIFQDPATAVTETILKNPDVNKYVNENSLSLQTINQELKGIPGKSKIFLLSRNS